MENIQERLKEAERLLKEKKLKESLEIYKELSDHIDSFSAISHDELLSYYITFGELYAKTGLMKEAKEVFDRGITHVKEGEVSLKVAELLNDSAFADKHLGYFETAEKSYKRSKNIYESLDQQINPFYIHTINNLGILLKEKGDLSESESLFEKALYILKNNQNLPQYFKMQIENNFAHYFFLAGRYEESKALFFSTMNDRVKAYGFKSPQYVESLNNLALFYSKSDKRTSERIYKKTVSLLNTLLKPDDIRRLKTDKNLAELYLNMGYYEDAEPLYEKTIDKMKQLRGEHYTVYRRALLQLAETKWKLNKVKAAETLLQECYDYFYSKKEIFKQEYIETLILFSQYLFDIGDDKKALEMVKTSLEEENDFLLNIIRGLSEDSALKVINKTTEHTGYFLSVIHRFRDDKKILNGYYPLIYARKSLAFEVSFQHRLEKAIRYDEVLKVKYETYKETRHELARRLFTGVGENEDKTLYEERQLKLIQLCNTLEKDLIRSLPDENAKNSGELSNLSENEFVLDFYKYNPYNFNNKHSEENMRYCRFKCSKVNDHLKIVLDDVKEANELDELVKEYREKICGDRVAKSTGRTRLSSINEKIDICKKLYDILVLDMKACVLNSADDKAPHCYISPDGEISNISFESLIGSNDDFFIDCFSMSYCNSVRELKKHSGIRKIKDAVIFANPEFDLEENKEQSKDNKTFYRKDTGLKNLLRKKVTNEEFYQKLSGTAKEGKAIKELLEENNIQVRYFDEKEAYEKKLKDINSPSILHIATHGFFIADKNEEVPHPLFRSGVVLSGVNTALRGHLLPEIYEDGVFTAYDATTMNLKNNEIVVLSACETGLGEVKNGEGIRGLRRSFAQAGANTVIMSLWRVSDEHTKILMERFYISLLEGKNLAVAMRDAQLALIEFLSDNFGFASPALWAGFICQGDIEAVGI